MQALALPLTLVALLVSSLVVKPAAAGWGVIEVGPVHRQISTNGFSPNRAAGYVPNQNGYHPGGYVPSNHSSYPLSNRSNYVPSNINYVPHRSTIPSSNNGYVPSSQRQVIIPSSRPIVRSEICSCFSIS